MILFRPFLCLLLSALALAPPAEQALAQSKKQQQAVPSPPPPPAPAAPAEDKPAPYDAQLNRLAELLGSISYLRSLCGADKEDWREPMRQLLDADTGKEPMRRERLTAAYNRGYRSFAAVYTACTPAAEAAAERYRNEGATLATEITSRFGN